MQAGRKGRKEGRKEGRTRKKKVRKDGSVRSKEGSKDKKEGSVGSKKGRKGQKEGGEKDECNLRLEMPSVRPWVQWALKRPGKKETRGRMEQNIETHK
jgi:hypothetical protein